MSDLNVVFFASNAGGALGYSGWYNNSAVSMLNLTEVNNALAGTANGVNVSIQIVSKIHDMQ